MTEFPHVFEPLQIRHKTLRSRINFGAHTANMAEGGLPSDRHIGYYRERAIGGAGMIVVEPIPVHKTGVLTRGNFLADDDSVIPHFRRLIDACRVEADVVMIHQLYHVGQHGDADNSFEPNWSPSGLVSYHDADGSHAMTESEIEELLEGFVTAASRAQASGFDGVELFAAYHAVIDQFWTPWSNRRTDQWGGSFENRMRFSRDLLERVRLACGEDFIIGLAVNMDPESEASLSVVEMQEIVGWHDERQLMDYVTCGTGSYFDFYKLMPTSLYPDNLGVPFAAALKKVVSHAKVQAESHVRTVEAAEQVLAADEADMVSIVRGQIADPHLVSKARGGRSNEIRPCISCNQLCWGRRSRDYFISCLVNPSAGREFIWGGDRPPPSSNRKSVLIVGGGPAGLEVARVAASRGHEVTLVEATDQLGGQFRLAGYQPTRSQILDNLRWYSQELERLGVVVELNHRMEPEELANSDADEVVIATGAVPARAGFQRALPMVEHLPGIEKAFDIADVLGGSVELEGRVAVIDDVGDWRGIGTAMFLQDAGCSVNLVSSQPTVAAGLFHSAADVPARKRFAGADGVMITNTVATSFTGAKLGLKSVLTGSESEIEVDAVVVAETPVSAPLLVDGHHRIGDCVSPRRASLAIYEGRRLGLRL